MAQTQETIADIIAEMNRVEVCAGGEPCLRDYADRLDAAMKRECEIADAKIADLQSRVKLWTDRSAELVAKCNEQYAKIKQVGDSAKLREALIKLRSAIYRDEDGDAHIAPDIIVENIIDAALAAPPRNCDKYATADEAHKRERGNCAKLRDALVQVQKKINYLIGNLTVPNSLVANRMEINGIINAALAAPATEQEGGAK